MFVKKKEKIYVNTFKQERRVICDEDEKRKNTEEDCVPEEEDNRTYLIFLKKKRKSKKYSVQKKMNFEGKIERELFIFISVLFVFFNSIQNKK